MSVLVDINPWGIVQDIHAEADASTALFREAYLERRRELTLQRDADGIIEVALDTLVFNLRVHKVIGGNQHNVYSNLKFLKQSLPLLKPLLRIEAHRGIKDPKIISRRNLYIPGMEKIDLSIPTHNGDIIFDRKDLADKNLMISSSPTGEKGREYWNKFRRYLHGPNVRKIYWNPASKQIHGGLKRETLNSLLRNVAIIQMNESEAETFVRNYFNDKGSAHDLRHVVQADWTIVTLGANGIRAYVNEEMYEEKPVDPTFTKEVLDGQYTEANDIGCGDVVLSTLIAIKECIPNIPIRAALNLANVMGALQFHNKGSNLSNIVSGIRLQEIGAS